MSVSRNRGPAAPGAMDLGSGHVGFKASWSPDRDLNPQYDGIPDIPWCGLTIEHTAPDGAECSGHITFAVPGTEIWPHHKWTVISFDPLHVEPSILCDCGDHGFIRDGRWVTA